MSLERRITSLEAYKAKRAGGDALMAFAFTDEAGNYREEVLTGGRIMSLDDYYRRYPHAEELLVLENVDPHRI